MAHPEQFLPAFKVALAVVFAVYIAVMFCGYYGYGDQVSNNVVHSMMRPPLAPCEVHSFSTDRQQSHSSGWIGVVMAFLVSVYLFLGFSLFFKCIAGMLQNLGDQANPVFIKDSC